LSASNDRVLVICGDSTAARYRNYDGIVGWGEAIPDWINSGTRVVDLAVPGTNASDCLRDVLPDALRLEPDYALVQFGHNANDSTREARAIDSLVAAFRRVGTKIVLITPMETRGLRQRHVDLDSGMRASAERLEVPLVKLDSLSHARWISAGPDSLAGFFVDSIHTRAAGAEVVARMIADALGLTVSELAR
jgi:lysophospholipase L1-like esterase